MKTDSESEKSVLKHCADEIQQILDERNVLISNSLKKLYESIQDFTAELHEIIKNKQERLNHKLSLLFEEAETLERKISGIKSFLNKISTEISKFIEHDGTAMITKIL